MRFSRCIVTSLGLVFLFCLFVLWGFASGRGLPFIGAKHRWSIGIYTSSSPLDVPLQPFEGNPVLSNEHVTDIEAVFVADPFMIRNQSVWYMFFEVLNKATNQGDIGYASSNDGFAWSYGKIVIDEDFHLSYPYVFEWEGTVYMIPETHETESVLLYRALSFPLDWQLVDVLLSGQEFTDNSIFRHDNKWWLFSAIRDRRLLLYFSDELNGPWKEHPLSPIVADDTSKARPAGRVVQSGSRLYRFTQDDSVLYGEKVWVFEITKLTVDDYEEKLALKKPILEPSGHGWNGLRMHHIDLHELSSGKWIASTDGLNRQVQFGWSY